MAFDERAPVRTLVLGSDGIARFVPAKAVGAYSRSAAEFAGSDKELSDMLASNDPEVWRPHCSKNTLFRLIDAKDNESLHLRIECKPHHSSDWIVPVPLNVSATLIPDLLKERGEPLDTEGKSASWRSREETLTKKYTSLVDEAWVATWEPNEDAIPHCMKTAVDKDPLDDSSDEEEATLVKAKKQFVRKKSDRRREEIAESEEDEPTTRGDAEEEIIVGYARNVWHLPKEAVVGPIGKPIVLSDAKFAALRKKTKVPFGEVLRYDNLTMLEAKDCKDEPARGLYVRYQPTSSPDKKRVLVALNKEVIDQLHMASHSSVTRVGDCTGHRVPHFEDSREGQTGWCRL
jgi:hypothetical protein